MFVCIVQVFSKGSELEGAIGTVLKSIAGVLETPVNEIKDVIGPLKAKEINGFLTDVVIKLQNLTEEIGKVI